MPSSPSMCSIKQASEDYLGSPLQLGGKTLRSGKDSGSVAVKFLLAETSTGCQQVYLVLHCLRYFQTSH
jgi:hypothetical protein